ncbi:MAG: NAAT family transporter [candidate division Zixibacteria bacterium]|nr:NAAT family transporter [candidate division Zixibacteria bacterium]
MDSLPVFIAKVFFGFFAIMNPVANAPIFVGLVADFDEDQKKVIARRSVITAFVVTAVFSLAGKLIFELFGLTLPAFRITGGILIFMVGLELLQGRLSKVQSPASANGKTARDSALRVAISPLAVPILAGPGTVATAMNFAATGPLLRVASAIAIFGLLCLVTYWFFIYGERVISFLGEGVVNVISRLMGLILAVIGTEMVLLGVRGAFEIIR